MKKWDADWDRLKLVTKVNKIRKKIVELENLIKRGSDSGDAATAIYMANKYGTI